MESEPGASAPTGLIAQSWDIGVRPLSHWGQVWSLGNRRECERVAFVMELHLTDKAAANIRRKGGTAVVDLLEPFG